jgi:protein phosphatase
VRVDLTWQQLRADDTIIVCSDGLTRTVRDDEIARAVSGSRYSAVPTPPDHPEVVCENLIALANKRGGPDNVTVVVARVSGPGLMAPQPGDRVERRAFVADAASRAEFFSRISRGSH